MSAKVHALPGAALPPQRNVEPVQGIIEELELLLADAKAGQLRAIAVAAVRLGDVTGTLWARPPDGSHGHTLASAANYLAHRINASMVEAGQPRAADRE